MYEGPGMYKHWKGGHYDVLGLTKHESTNRVCVVYKSMDVEHQAQRLLAGTQFVTRPLNHNDIDVDDHMGKPFNDVIYVDKHGNERPQFGPFRAPDSMPPLYDPYTAIERFVKVA